MDPFIIDQGILFRHPTGLIVRADTNSSIGLERPSDRIPSSLLNKLDFERKSERFTYSNHLMDLDLFTLQQIDVEAFKIMKRAGKHSV